MKITRPLRILFFILLYTCYAFGQTSLEGYVYDENSKKPLPYVAIILGNTGMYVTSNEDGKFRVQTKKIIDSLEIRHMGYEIKNVSVDFFLNNNTIYLKETFTTIPEVTISAKKENLYALINTLLKKYRNHKSESKSKAYFTLNSIAYSSTKEDVDSIPLEQIEALYNSKQKLSRGITLLNLKTGRFGQNRKDPFYSLYHVFLIRNFQLFQRKSSFLPQYVGNMSSSRIKNKYHLKLEANERYDGTIISFYPKTRKNNIFSGKIYFKRAGLIIEKIELSIINPKITELKSLNSKDIIVIKKLDLNILFNPIDYSKIQYFDFKLELSSSFQNIQRNITSKSILYLYNYNSSFIKPYFTSTIDFNNDYAKLLVLPVSDKIWKQNYPFPRSKNSLAIIDFFQEKKYNYYDNQIPPFALKDIKSTAILWDRERNLRFENIQIGPGVNLDFSYSLNAFDKADKNLHFTVKTLLNTKKSFFWSKRTARDLECINLAFDIFELNRQYLLEKIKKINTVEEAKILCEKANLDAKVMVSGMLNACFFKEDDDKLIQWRDKIHNKLINYYSF